MIAVPYPYPKLGLRGAVERDKIARRRDVLSQKVAKLLVVIMRSREGPVQVGLREAVHSGDGHRLLGQLAATFTLTVDHVCRKPVRLPEGLDVHYPWLRAFPVLETDEEVVLLDSSTDSPRFLVFNEVEGWLAYLGASVEEAASNFMSHDHRRWRLIEDDGTVSTAVVWDPDEINEVLRRNGFTLGTTVPG